MSSSLAQQVAQQIQDFLAEAPQAVVVENGEVIFDFSTAKYSIAPERERCVLQMWSEERNVVRRVVGAQVKAGVLKLEVMRFGQAKPSKLELCADADRRTPSAKKVMRAAYQRVLRRVLERSLPGWTVEKLTSAAALDRSFGPVHVRGLVKHGSAAYAVVGVNSLEAQASVDAALSTGVLWMHECRERLADKVHVQGLKLYVPAGRSEVVRMRMAHLHREAARWELYEIDERAEAVQSIDVQDIGNIATRLVHAPDEKAARERFAGSIAKVQEMCRLAEVVILSAGEISFRLNGLHFARAYMGFVPGTFRNAEQIAFGGGAAEIPLNDETEPLLQDLMSRLMAARGMTKKFTEPLYRMNPERWLESMVMRDVSALDEKMDAGCVYSQVPAFAASDRAMIDVLGVTRGGRLVVIELKANEDMHLPLQGLDYWARVCWHHERGEFQKFGYFAGRELSPERPLLLLVAPSLHVHPTTDVLLKYLRPEIEWKVLGLDERWREAVRVIFRKSGKH